MALANIPLLIAAIATTAACVFLLLRHIDPLQDIYFGKLSSRKSTFVLTIRFSALSCIGVYSAILVFLILSSPRHQLALSEAASLLCIPAAAFPVAVVGSYWSYYASGRYRQWLAKRFGKRQ